MNSQAIRLVCLAVITLPVIAIGASTVGLAQTKSFDAAYRGTLDRSGGQGASSAARARARHIDHHPLRRKSRTVRNATRSASSFLRARSHRITT